jgi:hypothetical protein
MTAVAAPTPFPSNPLYPGGSGDITATITNPNAFPVTLTAVILPSNTTYAAGYTDSSLKTARLGCSANTPSGVIWAFAASASGSTHTLTSPITVAANSDITVTFTNDARMATAAPRACESTYFSMPPLTGFIASAGAATTTATTNDSWTN